MKKLILRKLNMDPQEMVVTFHFHYPTRLDSRLSHYSTIEINGDNNAQLFFGICE